MWMESDLRFKSSHYYQLQPQQKIAIYRRSRLPCLFLSLSQTHELYQTTRTQLRPLATLQSIFLFLQILESLFLSPKMKTSKPSSSLHLLRSRVCLLFPTQKSGRSQQVSRKPIQFFCYRLLSRSTISSTQKTSGQNLHQKVSFSLALDAFSTFNPNPRAVEPLPLKSDSIILHLFSFALLCLPSDLSCPTFPTPLFLVLGSLKDY